MYGMVHRAARQMILEHHGQEHWSGVLATSGLGDDAFISANVYDDAVTQTLLGALSRHFETSVDSILQAFGEYWISFAFNGDYKTMMTMAGRDLGAFLRNLNRMHDSIQVSVPGARLPTFLVDDESDQSFTITYISDRSGMEPFVIGLLSGLVQHFGHTGEVRQIGPNGQGVQFQIILSNP